MADELSEEQKKQIEKIQQLKNAYIEVFGSDRGKIVLEDLGRKCFAHRPTFSGENGRMAFNEGQRSVLLHIENMQKINIERTKELMRKQKEEEENA